MLLFYLLLFISEAALALHPDAGHAHVLDCCRKALKGARDWEGGRGRRRAGNRSGPQQVQDAQQDGEDYCTCN